MLRASPTPLNAGSSRAARPELAAITAALASARTARLRGAVTRQRLRDRAHARQGGDGRFGAKSQRVGRVKVRLRRSVRRFYGGVSLGESYRRWEVESKVAKPCERSGPGMLLKIVHVERFLASVPLREGLPGQAAIPSSSPYRY